MYINKLKILTLGFILSILLFFLHPQGVFAEIINGSWSSTTNLTNQTASHVSTSEGGRLLIFGGANTDDFSEVYSSLINSDGSLSAWTIVSNLPETRFWGALVKKEKRLYVLGGAMFTGTTNYKNTVYSATIQLDGSISSWQSLASLPENRALGRAVIIGDRIYYAGGFNDSGVQDEVYYASINPDGTLGPWTTSSVSLPEPLFGFGMVEHQNNIIVVGGFNGSIFRDKTYKASVNPNGTISAWSETSTLPEPVYRSGVIRIGSTLISVGSNQTTLGNKVFYANINPDGTLGVWQTSSNTLPQAVGAGAIAYANGYLYLTGGFGSSGYVDTVYYAPLNISEGIDLPVPLLKQTDPLWGGFTYDSADEWAPPDPTDIARWGCALTSAAMVFQYHGITKLPNGIELNPGTLNVWLKNDIQPDSKQDGYVRNGLVNWLALNRLSKLAKTQNPDFAFDALDYARVGSNSAQLQEDLGNNIPGILEVPNHFVVAKGINNEDVFTINDPFYNREDLSSYSNTFSSLGRFIPSNTDLSYIMLVLNSNIDISVKNASGSAVGESFIQQPLENEETPGDFSGEPLRIFYFPDPASGNYQITLSSASFKNYLLDVYLYDKDGDVSVEHVPGIVGPQDADNHLVSFDKDNSDNSSSNQNTTFGSFINDIKSLHSLSEINYRNYLSLLAQAKTARALAGNQITKIGTLKLLKAMDKQVLRAKGRGISDNAYNILHTDIQALITSL